MKYDIKQMIKDFIRYETVCKWRDHHMPLDDDLEEFRNNKDQIKETTCKDCNSLLELEQDKDDPKIYWVREI